ncbi:MAG: hypothetical protein LDL31_07840 [Prosthecobacter sp.]|nr:hypothetical protein [Prosthecobacter sp.]
MTLSNAHFTANGCLVTIDGWMADVSSKLSLIEAGLCSVVALDFQRTEMADALSCAPFGDGLYACDDPRLVELAARYWDWSNSDGHSFEDMPVSVITDPVQAAIALQAWLHAHHSDRHGLPVL